MTREVKRAGEITREASGPRVLFAGGGTGGHLYPALALASAVQDERPDAQVEFVGARRGVEARILPQQNVRHTLLPLQPIQRDRIWRNWRLVPSFFGTAFGLGRVFLRYRPSLVVGTGGYVSGPACMWAVLTAVPMAIQEQNSHPGFTTRVLSRWAKQVHLGFPEAATKLRPGKHTEIVAAGNPIRPPDRSLNVAECRARFGIAPTSNVLLVVGGSQGSRAVNEALLGALEKVVRGELPEPPASLEIMWGTGPTQYEAVRDRLRSMGSPEWVHAYGYIEAMPEALAASNMAVSRAGAMATAELLAWGIPMVLIPLPSAAADHQRFNARALQEAGAALMVEEKDLSPDRLWADIHRLASDKARHTQMAAAALERARPDAARDIARRLLTLVAA
jgi:UDP-N-acetylglucosamine--N-acetylmuramyl-(pentapeptide) pyrophosphoryl-undecaprenol N-acetylglucosamine transferase